MEQVSNNQHTSGPDVVCLEGNGCRPSHRGDGFSVEGVMFTLNSTEVHCVAYGIGSYHSNAWKSKNPHSGVYLAKTAKTLDALNCGSPSCNQGGVAVVEMYGTDTDRDDLYKEHDCPEWDMPNAHIKNGYGGESSERSFGD